MKAISTIIAIVLLILIIVALVSLFWTFSISIFSRATETGTASVTHVVETLTSCMEIASTSRNTLYVRNCGLGVLTNDSLNIFIDNNKFNFSMTPESITSGELANVEIKGLWGISVGDHILTLANPKTDLRKEIEVELPDSCVLALDFDEGSGTVAYDKSNYGNDGILHNGTSEVCYDGYCPKWVNGKFGKALDFDAINDFVNISYSSVLNLTNETTLEAWVKVNSVVNWAGIVEQSNPTCAAPWIRYSLSTLTGPNRFSFGLYIGTSTQSATAPIQLNEWKHLMGTYNGSLMIMYVDGNIEDTTSVTGTISSSTGPVKVSQGTCDSSYFNGTIDSVRIYNKALTPDETVILKIR